MSENEVPVQERKRFAAPALNSVYAALTAFAIFLVCASLVSSDYYHNLPIWPILFLAYSCYVLDIMAVFSGILALNRVKCSQGALRGRGLAISGILAGAVTVALIGLLTLVLYVKSIPVMFFPDWSI